MGLGSFFTQLITLSSDKSSKSFAILVSTLTGALVILVVCFILIWDVLSNGHIETDLEELGVFILCIGGYVAGSSTSKIFADKYKKRRGDD